MSLAKSIWLKSLIKKTVRGNKVLNSLVYERGWWVRIPMGQLWVNWVFKTFFRQNIKCPYSVHFTSKVMLPEKIKFVGNPVSPLASLAVSGGCYIQAGNGIQIGEGTIWAPNVVIVSANHDPNNPESSWLDSSPVIIGRNCWIGANAVILPGVVLGDHTVVGAGAVVSHSFPGGNVVLVGVPARPSRLLEHPLLC